MIVTDASEGWGIQGRGAVLNAVMLSCCHAVMADAVNAGAVMPVERCSAVTPVERCSAVTAVERCSAVIGR